MSRRSKVVKGGIFTGAALAALLAICGDDIKDNYSGNGSGQSTPAALATYDPKDSLETALTYTADQLASVTASPTEYASIKTSIADRYPTLEAGLKTAYASETAKAGIEATATPTPGPSAYATATPIVSDPNNCPTVTLDEIVRTGQQAKMTLPFPACTPFSVNYSGPQGLLFEANYILPEDTPIMAPFSGKFTITAQDGVTGGVVFDIENSDLKIGTLIVANGGRISNNLNGQFIERGTIIGYTNEVIPPEKNYGGNGNLTIAYFVERNAVAYIKHTDQWVNGVQDIGLLK